MLNAALRKAAILVACLDDASADALLEQLPHEQAARIRRTVVELGEISRDEQQAVMQEFVRRTPGSAPPRRTATTMAAAPLSSQPATSAHRRRELPNATAPHPPAGPHFDFLREKPADALGPLLAGEHPQTITLVLAHLAPQRALDVLGELAPSLQVEVLRRLASLDETDPDALQQVEQGLQNRYRQWFGDDHRRQQGLEAARRILGVATGEVRRRMLAGLARHDRRLAERLHRPRCSFADLADVDNATWTSLLSAAEPELLVLALAGAEPRLVSRVLRLLPPEDAARISGAIDALGPTRLSDVEDAQFELAQLACQLDLQGELELPRPDAGGVELQLSGNA